MTGWQRQQANALTPVACLPSFGRLEVLFRVEILIQLSFSDEKGERRAQQRVLGLLVRRSDIPTARYCKGRSVE